MQAVWMVLGVALGFVFGFGVAHGMIGEPFWIVIVLFGVANQALGLLAAYVYVKVRDKRVAPKFIIVTDEPCVDSQLSKICADKDNVLWAKDGHGQWFVSVDNGDTWQYSDPRG